MATQLLARYHTKCKVLCVSGNALDWSWREASSIPADALAAFDNENGPRLVDAAVQCSQGDLPRKSATRTIEQTPSIIPSFTQLTNPSVLQAPGQPIKIHSIDEEKKTAVVSCSKSPNRIVMPWKAILSQNPELLATFMIETKLP